MSPNVKHWLLWVRGLRGPAVQLVVTYDAKAAGPHIDEGIKGKVICSHQISPLLAETSSLKRLAVAYPCPDVVEKED